MEGKIVNEIGRVMGIGMRIEVDQVVFFIEVINI